MDYKNTPEGRAIQSKYGKILHSSRPEPPHNHPRMPMSNRAKIFSPFAALRGYEDEIDSEGRDHLKGNRIELSEEGKEVLSQKISQLRKGQELTIKYFTDGYYENVAGVLDAVDVINKELRIYTGFINDTGKELPTIIAFEDILEIGVNMTSDPPFGYRNLFIINTLIYYFLLYSFIVSLATSSQLYFSQIKSAA